MAAIDKIYGTTEQYNEFKKWCRYNWSGALQYFYKWYPEWNDGKEHPMTNFPEHIDMWLLKNCPFEYVISAIKNQYGIKA